jgi:hypothetical protein
MADYRTQRNFARQSIIYQKPKASAERCALQNDDIPGTAKRSEMAFGSSDSQSGRLFTSHVLCQSNSTERAQDDNKKRWSAPSRQQYESYEYERNIAGRSDGVDPQ